MNSQPKKHRSAGDWAFYLILGLCVAALGAAGYYYFVADSPFPVSAGPVNVQDVMNPRTSAATSVGSTSAKPQTTQGSSPSSSSAVSSSASGSSGSAAATSQSQKKLILSAPVKGAVLTKYSGDELVYDPTMGDWRTHNGVDYACTDGEEVHAVADGTVQDVYADEYYGVSVLIDHGNGLQTIYTGLSEATASLKGTQVARGAVLGRAGDSALFESALEPHVHLEMLQNGVRIDPESMIQH